MSFFLQQEKYRILPESSEALDLVNYEFVYKQSLCSYGNAIRAANLIRASLVNYHVNVFNT